MTEKERSAAKVLEWATAGEQAVKLADQQQQAKLYGDPMPEPTEKNIGTTIRGAMKRFLDGDISNKQIKASMMQAGLDIENLRTEIVEKTMARAIQKIINEGDIERLQEIGLATGEVPLSNGQTKIVRERITIEIDGDNVREVEAIEHR